MNVSQYRAAQHALFEVLSQGSAITTTVPFRKNYENAALCLTFVHLLERKLADDITHKLIDPLQEIEPCHYWYPADDLHLTIKNIRSAAPGRSYSDQEVQRATDALQRAVPELCTLDFEILGPICMPTSIVLRAFGTVDHRHAVLDLDRHLAAVGMADDKRYAATEVVVSNITLCRFTEQPRPTLKARVLASESMSFGTYRVDSLQLMQCDEVCSVTSRKIHAAVALPNK